jgi:hypothetical protein
MSSPLQNARAFHAGLKAGDAGAMAAVVEEAVPIERP